MPHKSCESLYVNDVGAVTTEIMIAHVILQDPDGSPSVFARVDRYSHITPPGPIMSVHLMRKWQTLQNWRGCFVTKKFAYTVLYAKISFILDFKVVHYMRKFIASVKMTSFDE
jgi:hypothetical protein